MTSGTDPRYGIAVAIDSYKPTCGWTRAEWRARPHRLIEVHSTLDRTAAQRYAREEVLTVYRWCAGVLARAVLLLDYEVRFDEQERGHRCDPQGDPCGFLFELGVCDPGFALGSTTLLNGKVMWHSPPCVCFQVPTERAEAWAAHFRKSIVAMLTQDVTPLDATPTGHGGVTITDPTSTPRKAST